MARQAPDAGLLRRINRKAVIQQLRLDATAAPSHLARVLGISLPTVMRVLEDLTAEGLVVSDGFQDSSGGRRASRMRFNGQAHAAVCVHVGVDVMRGVICDLNGRFLEDRNLPTPLGPEASLTALTGLIAGLLAWAGQTGLALRGLGVGVPSMVRHPEGLVVRTLDQLGWAMLPLREILHARFALPTFVDRERDLAVVAELGFGAGRGHRHVVALTLGAGAGAGLVVDGKLFRGGNFSAGEVKWFLDDPRLGGADLPLLGHRQSLRFQRGVPMEAYEALAQLSQAYDNGHFTIADLDAGLVGLGPVEIVQQLLDYATRGVASLVAVLSPDIVILSGPISAGGDLVLDHLRFRLGEDVYTVPPIVYSALGDDAVILGSVMTILDETVF